MKDTILLSIPAEARYISIVRLTASALANELGFDIEDVEDIRVCVSEACNNAIQNNKSINMAFTLEDNALKIDIDGFSKPNSKQGKLGYMIMSSLMDVVLETPTGIHLVKAKED